MKRPRIYKPRRGIRFDNRRVNGPDGSYIGSDIEVVTLTGSVMTSATQRYGSYELTQVPIIGYPRNSAEMRAATGGGSNPGGDSTTRWVGYGVGFDYGGENFNSISFDDGFGNTIYLFDGFLLASSYYQTGAGWQGTTFSGTVESSYNSADGPRRNLDIGRADIPADQAIRFMTTGSYIAATIGTPSAPYYDMAICPVFMYTDNTASFDIYAHGARPSTAPKGWSLTMVTGNLRFTVADQLTSVQCSVPIQPHQWYVALASFRGPSTGLPVPFTLNITAVPFWGGEPISATTSSSDITSLTGTLVSARLGDNLVYRASSDLRLSAIYVAPDTAYITQETIEAAVTSLQRCLSAPYTVVFETENTVDDSIASFGTAFESRYLNQRLLGLGTGSLGRTFGLVDFVTGSIPSWTNVHIGTSQAFVSTALSSSDHESRVLNAYRSGSRSLEITAVPASASMYYSKKSKYNKITVKRTASLEMVTPPLNANLPYRPYRFTPVSGALLNASTGSTGVAGVNADPTIAAACSVAFEVPQKGKLVDISVWVEIHHQSGSTLEAGISADGICTPLGPLGIALRSPNVRFGSGLPFNSYDANPATAGTGLAKYFQEHSYLLWAGLGLDSYNYAAYSLSTASSVADPDETISPNSDIRRNYATWERDRDMRTVFNDGAPVANPRHNYYTPGYSYASGNFVGAPNSALGFNNAWGFGISWTGSVGSPPPGWLSGPGGTNAVNEWPTTGSNRGAAVIKPILPMLDPITLRWEPPAPGVTYPTTIDSRPYDAEELSWTRPGLRGTEISGTWYLLISHTSEESVTARLTTAYLRQARLELTYEEHEDAETVRRDRSSVTPGRQGLSALRFSVSSSYQGLTTGPTASMNVFIDRTQQAEVGRTFGVVLNTGSIDKSQHALVYRLTGSLADLSGSAPGWLLNNRFGMPVIPLSSASLVPYVEQPLVTTHPQDLLSVRPILDGARRLSDAARDASPSRTLVQQFAVALSGTAT